MTKLKTCMAKTFPLTSYQRIDRPSARSQKLKEILAKIKTMDADVKPSAMGTDT